MDTINKTISINAPVATVWQHLTKPALMKQWMLDTDMEMDIITDWNVGSAINMKGNLHQIKFENKGIIKRYEPENMLQYSHLSSLSKLAGRPENYCLLTFSLKPAVAQTELNLMITNFPSDTIFKHLRFYWNNALELMKKLIEEAADHSLSDNA
jgi:uncharacterized protein YndB with AHSA1/START domain